MSESTFDETKPHVSCTCPCGGTFTAGTTTEDVPLVLHSMPPCDDFVRREVVDFLAWARTNGARSLS